MLVFEFLVGLAETFLCSASAPLVKIVLLLDALRLLLLSVGSLMCQEAKQFILI
jgi:hypothetical protein